MAFATDLLIGLPPFPSMQPLPGTAFLSRAVHLKKASGWLALRYLVGSRQENQVLDSLPWNTELEAATVPF
ncbi:hypothetical protein RRF57_004312 [Xylaria bambusicola]|uniref:Uncharacterized protein n=1 Tax=Xylaria bambusicola TaxID=326684 RepID=A0AAN7Z4A5_9PEZI